MPFDGRPSLKGETALDFVCENSISLVIEQYTLIPYLKQ